MTRVFDKKRFYIILLIGFLLISATLVAYRQVRYADFAGFDDELYVTKNRHVQAGLTRDGVVWAFTSTESANWHPMTWLSHMLDSEFYGLNPGGHHGTSLMFHMANSLLLFLIFSQMTGSLWRSAFVAALFALHPLNVESVAWISERKNLLSTFFGFLSVAAYIRYVRKRQVIGYLLCLLFLCLGLMAKPMLVTLPFVLLLLDYWPLGRFDGEGDVEANSMGAAGIDRKRLFRLVWEKVPLFIPVVFSCITTLIDEQRIGAVQSLAQFSFSDRAANALVAYVRYIVKSIWPYHLSVYYPHPGDALPVWQVLGAALLVAGVSVLTVQSKDRHPYVSVGWFWFLGTLVPVIGLVQIGGQALADRYTYIPIIGIMVIITWGASDLMMNRRYNRIVLTVLAVAILSALSLRTILQVSYWKNAVTLFENAARLYPENNLVHNNLGTALFAEGYAEKAVFHFEEALRVEPGDVVARTNLATLLSLQKNDEEAEIHFKEALRIDPNHSAAHYHLGILFKKQRKIDDAYAHFAQAIRINPDYAEAYNQLGLILSRRGQFDEADVFFSRALEINADFEKARKNLEENRKNLSISVKIP